MDLKKDRLEFLLRHIQYLERHTDRLSRTDCSGSDRSWRIRLSEALRNRICDLLRKLGDKCDLREVHWPQNADVECVVFMGTGERGQYEPILTYSHVHREQEIRGTSVEDYLTDIVEELYDVIRRIREQNEWYQ